MPLTKSYTSDKELSIGDRVYIKPKDTHGEIKDVKMDDTCWVDFEDEYGGLNYHEDYLKKV